MSGLKRKQPFSEEIPQNTSTEALQGDQLIAQVVEESGVPSEWAEDELNKILGESGCQKDDLTLDQLRFAMIRYLETLLEAEPDEDDESVSPVKH